jgi:hypothetical protein
MARRIITSGITPEERQARKLSKLLTEDFALDIEQMGYYLVRNNPLIVYHRFDVLSLTAQEEYDKLMKEMKGSHIGYR